MVFPLTDQMQSELNREMIPDQDYLAGPFYEEMVHKMPVPIAVFKVSTGQCININRAFEKLLGYPREEIIDRFNVHHGLWLDPQERIELHALLFKDGAVRDRDITLLDVADDIRHCLYSAEVVRFEEESYVISTFIDITERKNAGMNCLCSQRLHE